MNDYPPVNTEKRIGVILCQCGGEISRRVDFERLSQAVGRSPEAAYLACEAYPCSKDGLERLEQAIREDNLERVLVAGCSPRLVEGRFRQAIRHAGLPGEYLEVVNIRELCRSQADATIQAAAALELGLAKLANVSPAHPHTNHVIQAALVVGGGLGGLTIAQQLAAHGIPVKLVAAGDRLGGDLEIPVELVQLGEEQGQALMAHNQVRVYLGASLVDVQGGPGDYLVQVEYRGDDSLNYRQTATLSVGAILIASDGQTAHNGGNRMAPESNEHISALFGLPQDRDGYLVEPRWRLRPGRVIDAGIFLCGDAHQSTDAIGTLYQAYKTSAQALRFLQQESLEVSFPLAEVDAALCTGCGSCVPACPTHAIHMVERLTRREIGRSSTRTASILPGSRADVLSLSKVDALRCIGCGSCTVACPVRAIDLPGWNQASILGQIEAALRPNFDLLQPGLTETRGGPRVLVMACEWGAYAAAEIYGKCDGASMPADVRLLRLNCSARFDPDHALWAFLNGADGVLLGVCPPGACHYADGNWKALQRCNELKRRLNEHGFDPARLEMVFVSGDEGEGFARSVNDFVEKLGGPYVEKIRSAGLVAR